MRWAIGCDIGGTKLALALVSDTGLVRDFRRLATPAAPRPMIEAIAEYIAKLGASELPLGVSVAGTVATDGRLSLGSHIDWATSSFGDQLAQHHRARVRVVSTTARRPRSGSSCTADPKRRRFWPSASEPDSAAA